MLPFELQVILIVIAGVTLGIVGCIIVENLWPERD
jgi:hypothetical protein